LLLLGLELASIKPRQPHLNIGSNIKLIQLVTILSQSNQPQSQIELIFIHEVTMSAAHFPNGFELIDR